ncbi:MAG: glycosyltransferase family 2 protein [Actinobacteria bacterium]|nr:glycosyltransferase family 2 protein [Actinomycetota bacterium]
MTSSGGGDVVRVVVVTYSPGETLRRFLDTLGRATSLPVEVVMADNGSTDSAPEEEAAAGRAVLLRTGGNLGYGAAANRGAANATGTWLVVANPDIEWTPGSIDEMITAARRWPLAGVIGPRIVTTDGRLYPSARALPELGTGIGHALMGWWWPTNPWTRAYRREDADPVEGPTGWLSGSCLLFRREAFEAVGGFDPAYFMFFEDVDVCDRLGRAGWQVVHAPDALVRHVGGHSWRDQPGIMIKAHHASAIRYLERRYGRIWQAPLRAVLRGGLGARYLAARVVRRIGRGAEPTRMAT